MLVLLVAVGGERVLMLRDDQLVFHRFSGVG